MSESSPVRTAWNSLVRRKHSLSESINWYAFQHYLPHRRIDYQRSEYGQLLRSFLGYHFGRALGPEASFRLSIRALRRRARTEENLRDVVSTAFDYAGFGEYYTIRPMQSRKELRKLARRAARIEPETVLEIGTARGGTFYVWTRHFSSVDTAVSVDLQASDSPGPTIDPEFVQQFRDDGIVTIRGDAHDDDVLEAVRDHLGEVDFLFIDADKSYEGVKRHFEMYGPLVSDGGIVAFHDIRYDDGVRKFWPELEEDFDTERIVDPVDRLPGRYEFGVGIVHMN